MSDVLETASIADGEFMGVRQQAFFRRRLLDWRDDILRDTKATLAALGERENHTDPVDRAVTDADRAVDLRARDRQRKLLAKIESALARLEDGSYGWCEETGEAIGFRRLEARPIATLCIEAQERHERREKAHREF